MKIRAHTCYLGKTGYSYHARGFFREISKYFDLRVRNFTFDETPKEYLDESDLKIIDLFTLSGESLYDKPITEIVEEKWWDGYEGLDFLSHDPDWIPDIDIVLMEQNHYYFYQEYSSKLKIAYTVWESTRLSESFFETLLDKFDFVIVVSEWHKKCLIDQGYPEYRIFIIPEGFNSDIIVDESTEFDKFRFLVFGRWDYRKSIPEILKSISEEFNEDIEIIASVENPYSKDGIGSTEERLEFFGIKDHRITIKKFPPRDEYLKILRTGQILVTCARSEGWNIPLMEGIASGIPVTYSDYGAQLEFARGLGNSVRIKGMEEAEDDIGNLIGGYYASPDFSDLKKTLRRIYNEWETHKKKALLDSHLIKKEFNWNKIGLIGKEVFKKIIRTMENQIIIDFKNGPRVEILGGNEKKYFVEFIDRKKGILHHSGEIKNNCWISCFIKYFVDWRIRITDTEDPNWIYIHDYNPNGKKVYISLESSSLGDTIAWVPYAEEFRKKWGCQVYLSTFMNHLFSEEYPELIFVNPEYWENDLYTIYKIGWFYNGDYPNLEMNPSEFKNIPMQKASSDILGLEYKEIRPRIKNVEGRRQIEGDYVCIAIHGTAQAKYWNNEKGWQELIDWLNWCGYKVVLISKENSGYMGNFHPSGIIDKSGDLPIESRILDLQYAKAFIGIGSGLSWLAWAVGRPVVMISGFSEEYSEFNCVRVINKNSCNGCFNRCKLDPNDWNWCPDHKNTDRQFECTKKITSANVIESIINSKILERK